MKLFILREVWTETYDCPDNGLTDICETYADINVSQDAGILQAIADNLTSGFRGRYWSEKRANELQALYPQYDGHRESRFVVLDISNLLIPESEA